MASNMAPSSVVAIAAPAAAPTFFTTSVPGLPAGPVTAGAGLVDVSEPGCPWAEWPGVSEPDSPAVGLAGFSGEVLVVPAPPAFVPLALFFSSLLSGSRAAPPEPAVVVADPASVPVPPELASVVSSENSLPNDARTL